MDGNTVILSAALPAPGKEGQGLQALQRQADAFLDAGSSVGHIFLRGRVDPTTGEPDRDREDPGITFGSGHHGPRDPFGPEIPRGAMAPVLPRILLVLSFSALSLVGAFAGARAGEHAQEGQEEGTEGGDPAAAPPVQAAEEAGRIGEDQALPRDERGWTVGEPAASRADLTARPDAVELYLPTFVRQHVTRQTVVFYFSPRCPHCVAVVPELSALARRLEGEVDFLGVISRYASSGDLATFQQEHDLPFSLLRDDHGHFALSCGLTSTPSVLVLAPVEGGDEAREGAGAEGAGAPEGEARPESTEAPEPEGSEPAAASPESPSFEGGPVQVLEAYLPYPRGTATVLEMRLVDDPEAVLAAGRYTGPYTCLACHEQEARSWTLTWHAMSWYRQVRAGNGDRPACARCHTTRFLGAEAGEDQGHRGFVMGDHGSPFGSVTCEACHTASGPHDGESSDPAASCVRCHDEDHSLFHYERALPHIDHYRALRVEDAEQEQIRIRMAQGDAPRPLLALPHEPPATAETCVSCHRPQVRRWRKGPHASAMDTLEGPDAEKPECVRCHATPKGALSEAASVEDYRTGEGVACASCHGSAAEHARSPATRSPWGLDMAEPACALEGLCRRCHTPAWDPGWSLEERLEAVSH